MYHLLKSNAINLSVKGGTAHNIVEPFMDIFAPKHQGLKISPNTRKLGKHRNTVKKYFESETIP